MIPAMRIWHTREAGREAEREGEGGRQSGKARVRERERERERKARERERAFHWTTTARGYLSSAHDSSNSHTAYDTSAALQNKQIFVFAQ